MKKQFLFLDRDGVINTRIPGAYIRHIGEFHLEAGVLEALALLRPFFGRIVIVTNQAGIAKGLMTADDLQLIHEHLQRMATAAGCPVDAFYFCPDRANSGSKCRKPASGMGIQAQLQFPEIDFESSWMVGDSVSDIEFGKKLAMKTVLVAGKAEESELDAGADWIVDSLLDFAKQYIEAITRDQV